MKTSGERLSFARTRAGYRSAREAALSLGVSVSTYNSHERAGQPGARAFKLESAKKYARLFGVSAAWLLTGEGKVPPGTQHQEIAHSIQIAHVHVQGFVQAGVWTEFEEFSDMDIETIPVIPGKWAGYRQFAYRVQGPSMNRVRLFDGDYVVCVPYWEAVREHSNNELVVVERRRAGTTERTVKQIEIAPDGTCQLWPRSDDPRFQTPIPCAGPEPDGTEIVIVGLVIGSFTPR